MKKNKIRILFNPDVIKNIHLILLNRIQKKSSKKKYSSEISQKSELKKKLKIFSESDTNIYQSLFPRESNLIIEKSSQILRKYFRFLGTDFIFDQIINWNYDPKDKLDWKLKEYDERKIPYPGSPKDVKVTWELNRHQYLFTIAKSYIITKDEKYAKSIIDHLESWIAQNPIGQSINWASPMEISIRMISWIFALDLILGSESYEKNEPIILKSISEHIIFLKYHLSNDRLIHTNHLIGELSGLIIASIVFDFKDSAIIRKKALTDLVKELKDQVFDDGVSKEQSSSYHRFVIDFLTLVVVISEKAKIKIPKDISETLEKMINYIDAAITPDGGLPMVGDADNGRGFILSEQYDFWDSKHVLSNGAILYRNGKFKKSSFSLHEESFWLFGQEGKSIYDSVQEKESDYKYSYFFNSGHYTVKNNNTGFYFFVRGGQYGMGGNFFSSHSHFDLLSPVIYFKNKPFLVDAGTFVYNGDTANRNKFRISNAHNNITWNEAIVVPKQNFGWEKVKNALLVENSQNDISDTLRFRLNKITGYEREFKIKNDSVTIADYFTRDFDQLEWNFHFHPNCQIQVKDENSFIITNDDVKVILKSNTKGLTIIGSEVSFNYGEKMNNLCIHLKKSVIQNDIVEFTIESI